MKIEIKKNNMSADLELQLYIERRIYFALSRFTHQIRTITVRLQDINGPKGGNDKKCQIVIRLKSKTLILEGLEDNFFTAVDLTAARAQRGVSREIDRMKDFKTRSIQYLPEYAF